MRPHSTWPRTGCSGYAGASARLSKPAAMTTRSASASRSAVRVAQHPARRAGAAGFDARHAAAHPHADAGPREPGVDQARRPHPAGARMPEGGRIGRQARGHQPGRIGTPAIRWALRPTSRAAGGRRRRRAARARRWRASPSLRPATVRAAARWRGSPRGSGARAGRRRARHAAPAARPAGRKRPQPAAGRHRAPRPASRGAQGWPRPPRRPGRRRPRHSARRASGAALRAAPAHLPGRLEHALQAVALGRHARRLGQLEAVLGQRIADRPRDGPGREPRAAPGEARHRLEGVGRPHRRLRCGLKPSRKMLSASKRWARSIGWTSPMHSVSSTWPPSNQSR